MFYFILLLILCAAVALFFIKSIRSGMADQKKLSDEEKAEQQAFHGL